MGERINFASDNTAGVHPAVMEALARANEGRAPSYGDDAFTKAAKARLREIFGIDTIPFFVLTGTAANVLGLKCLLKSHEAVIHPHMAHIHTDEAGAPEAVIGCKTLSVPVEADGKLTPERIAPLLTAKGVPHHSQPKVVSIAQSNEWGAVYTPQEVRALADFAHAHDLYLHMDGARLANAGAALDAPLGVFTRGAGVDVWTFGGTKNGLMIGEAVIFANSALAESFPYVRKQGMQLYAKMRFIGAQFLAYMDDSLWLENARHANRMARRLAQGIADIAGAKILHPAEANAVFVRMTAEASRALQERFDFYVFAETATRHDIRFMTSFATTPSEVDALIEGMRLCAG